MTPAEGLIDAAEDSWRRAGVAEDDEAEWRVIVGHGRTAVRLYRQAAGLLTGNARLDAFRRALEVAEAIDARHSMLEIVREAMGCEPDEDTIGLFRAAWEAAAVVLKTDECCPEPARPGTRTILDRKAPLPDQMAFNWGRSK